MGLGHVAGVIGGIEGRIVVLEGIEGLVEAEIFIAGFPVGGLVLVEEFESAVHAGFLP